MKKILLHDLLMLLVVASLLTVFSVVYAETNVESISKEGIATGPIQPYC